MPYYLRLRNFPTIEEDKNAGENNNIKKKTAPKTTRQNTSRAGQDICIHVKLCCTTELNDAFYDGDLSIRVSILHEPSSRNAIGSCQLKWKKGFRILNEVTTLSCNEQLDRWHMYWLHFGVDYDGRNKRDSKFTIGFDRISLSSMPEILGITAPLFRSGQRESSNVDLEEHVLRNLEFSNTCLLQIYEEMGENVALHIWDSALALLACCAISKNQGVPPNVSGQLPELIELMDPLFDKTKRRISDRLTIIELGAGCGTVGLGLARLVPDTRVILTDVPEAMEILNRNIYRTTDLGVANGTTVEDRELNWNLAFDDSPSVDVAVDNGRWEFPDLHPDVVLVSDCIYNPDPYGSLIATLVRFMKQKYQDISRSTSIDLDVLVAYKIRHESESEPFKAMQEAGFEVLSQANVLFPDRIRDDKKLDLDKVELHAFRYRYK